MTQRKLLKIADVARHSGVSVRTLQYYDDIGLLTADRSAKGYRLYGDWHLLRLQQILIERSLGRPLEDIRRLLDDPAFDRVGSLKIQRQKMADRLSETHQMIASIDAALAQLKPPSRKDLTMDPKSILDGFDPSAFEVEAQERWGNIDAWATSQKRTKRYGEPDWRQIKAELAEIWTDAAKAMEAGEAHDGKVALALAERHRCHIDRWFYPLTPMAHVGLADMWEADPRFQANIDKYGDGLTAWIAGAVRIAANLS